MLSSRRRHTRWPRDWSSDVCSSDLKGFAFSPDSPMQKEFEASFPYRETEDQLRCVEEIKKDMESEQPMDRLDRKSTRLNSSHVAISYAVFCLKKTQLE